MKKANKNISYVYRYTKNFKVRSVINGFKFAAMDVGKQAN